MGWFDEQIKQRKLSDNQVFEDSFAKIADAVLGKRTSFHFDDSIYTQDAMNQILKYYGFDSEELPKEITDFNEQLEYLCRPHGIMRRNIKLTKGWYKDAFGALLGFYKENHKPVALVPGTTHGYCFIKDGKTYHVNSNNEDLFEKDAYCFYKPLPLKKISTVDLLKYCFETRTVFDNIYIIDCTCTCFFNSCIDQNSSVLRSNNCIKPCTNCSSYNCAKIMRIFNAIKKDYGRIFFFFWLFKKPRRP